MPSDWGFEPNLLLSSAIEQNVRRRKSSDARAERSTLYDCPLQYRNDRGTLEMGVVRSFTTLLPRVLMGWYFGILCAAFSVLEWQGLVLP